MTLDGRPFTDEQKSIIVVAAILATLSTTSTALRFYCRRRTGAPLWWDDGFIVVAQVLSYALCADLIVGAECGLSQHRDAFTDEEFAKNVTCFLESLYILEPFYACCMPAVKLGILLLYWRLFQTVRWMRIAIITTAVTVCLWMIGAQAAGVFQCWPIEKFWNPLMPGHCINGHVYFVTITSLNLMTDAMTLCLPIPIIKNLQVSWRQRVTLLAGFLIGGFVSLISIIRIRYLNNPHDPDTLYDATQGPIWTAAETSLAVVCANLPVIYVLFRRTLERVVNTFDEGSAGTRKRQGHYELSERSRATLSGARGSNRKGSKHPADLVLGESEQDDHVSERSAAGILSPNKIYVRTRYEVDVQQQTPTREQHFTKEAALGDWS